MANFEALKEKAIKARKAREQILKNEENSVDNSETKETLEEKNSADNAKPESKFESAMKYMGFFLGFGSKTSQKEEYFDKDKKIFDATRDYWFSYDDNPYSGQSSALGTFDINFYI